MSTRATKSRKLIASFAALLLALTATFALAYQAQQAHAANTSVESWAGLDAAIAEASDGDTITLTKDIVAEGTITIGNKRVTIAGTGKTIYSKAGRDTYDSMFKVTSGGGLTIGSGVTLSGKTSTNGASGTCPDSVTYTADKFTGAGYEGDATTYTPKGFFIQVEGGGAATLNGTISDFITSRDKATTPRYVAPVVAHGAGATFNLGASGTIKNNLVGYIADDSKANDDAQAIKRYVKGGPPNSLRVPNAHEQKSDPGKYERIRGRDAGIDGGSPGTGITATAGAVIYKDGATGTIEGAIDNNRGDTGGVMASGNDTVVHIKNATVSRNVGVQFGGGSTTEQGAVIAMHSGTMKQNVAWFGGGAVFATENGVDWLLGKMVEADGAPKFDDRKDGVFTMAGGELTDNTAFTRGGAILVDSDGVAVTAGKLTNNMSRMLGGAVYVMGDHPKYTYTMVIDPVYVHDNLAVSGQERAREWGSSDGDGQRAPGSAMKTKSELDAANELLQRNLRPAQTACGDIPDGDLFAGQGTFSKNSDDSEDGKGIDGTGGGVWLCPYGAVNFDAAQVGHVVIANNYATGTLKNIPRNNPAYADSQYNSDASAQSRSGITGGSDFHADAGKEGGGVTIKDLAGSGWVDENTGQPYTTEVNTNRVNLVSTREPGSGSTADVTSLPESQRVEVSGNISRRGGGLAADGRFYLGEATSTATVGGKMTVTKVWSAGAKQQPIAIRVSVAKGDNEVVLADVPLDGVANEPIGGEFDTVKELAPRGFIWTGEFSLPLTVTAEDGTPIELYELWHNGAKIDINTSGGREDLGGLVTAGKQQEVEVRPGAGVTVKYTELEAAKDENGNTVVKTDEAGNVTEYTTHQFTPGAVDLSSLTYEVSGDVVTQKVIDSNGQIVDKTLFGSYTFGVPLQVAVGNDNEAIVEKYVNQDVHSDIVNFDQTFTYDIMAYVPTTATEFTISDKLVAGLEFADKDGNPSTNPNDVVRSVVVKYNNNHEVGENGTVTSGAIVKTPNGNPIDFIQFEKGWPGKGYLPQMAISGDELTVKIDELGHPQGNDKFDLEQARGRWVQVTFNARIKDEFRTLDALRALQESWADTDADKNSEDAHDVEFANGDLIYYNGLMAQIGPDPIIWAAEAPERLFARSTRGDYYVTTDGKAGQNWELIAAGTADWDEANDRYTGQGVDTIHALDIEGEDAGLVAPLKNMPRVIGAKINKGAEGGTRIFLEVTNPAKQKEIWYTDDKLNAATWTQAMPNTDVYNNGVARLKPDSGTIRMLDFTTGVITIPGDGKNWPVLSEEAHEGMKNEASYNVKFGNNAEGTYKSNVVTVTPETAELDVTKNWAPEADGWPKDVETVTFAVYGVKTEQGVATEKAVYVDAEGKFVGLFANEAEAPADSKALTVELTADDPATPADESKATVEDLPKLKNVRYIARETKVNDVEVAYNSDKTLASATTDNLTVFGSMGDTTRDERFANVADALEAGDRALSCVEYDDKLYVKTAEGRFYLADAQGQDAPAADAWTQIVVPVEPAQDEDRTEYEAAVAQLKLAEDLFAGKVPDIIPLDLVETFVATNSEPATEKYVNNDVHADLVEFDKAFKYDIMVFVPAGATELVITDPLVQAIEFAKAKDSLDAADTEAAEKATTAGETIVSIVTKAKNDHTADSTVAGKDSDNAGTPITPKSTAIDNNTLRVTFEGKADPDNEGMKLPLDFAGTWVQVTFWAKYTDAIIEAANIGDVKKIKENGAVISTEYPADGQGEGDDTYAHDGTANQAAAEFIINNNSESKFVLNTNEVTVKPETTNVYAQKKLLPKTGDEVLTAWPTDLNSVTFGVFNGDKKVEGADMLVTNLEVQKSKDLPKLIGVTYTVQEIAIDGAYAKEGDIAGEGTEAQPYVVTNRSTKGETELEIPVKIVKVSDDGTTQTPLEGARLQLKQGDAILNQWTSSAEPFATTLKPGSYEVYEAEAPEGYNLANPNPCEFTLNEDGSVTGEGATLDEDGITVVVTMVDTPVPGPEPIKVPLNVTKEFVTLPEPDLGEQTFTFDLLDRSGAVVSTTTVVGNGSATFDELEFAEAGVYIYTIQERDSGVAGVLYDTVGRQVTVVVTDSVVGEPGALKHELSCEVVGDNPTITNRQVAPESVNVPLEAKKILEGATLEMGMFQFSLKGDGVDLSVSNGVAGDPSKVAFPAINFAAAGEYAFTITEVPGNNAAIDYAADTEVTATVKIAFDAVTNKYVCESVTYSPETAEFTNVLNKYPVKVSKVAAGQTTELPGATLRLVNAATGEEVETWTSGETPHEVEVKPGTFTLIEDGAPLGYDIAASITFVVTVDGAVMVKGAPVDVVQMTDKPKRFPVELSKVDAADGTTEIPGAQMALYDAAGVEVESWNSGNTPHRVQVTMGTYTLKELAPAPGYLMSEEAAAGVEFTVDGEGKVTGVTKIENAREEEPVEPEEPGKLTVTKRVQGEGASANEEFEFAVTYTPLGVDQPVTETVKLKANESKSFQAAADTDYTVVEKLTDEQKKAGWAAEKTESTGKIGAAGSEVVVEAKNTFTKPEEPVEPEKPCKLIVKKVVETKGAPANEEFEFAVRYTKLGETEPTTETFKLKAGESKEIDGIAKGSYYLVGENLSAAQQAAGWYLADKGHVENEDNTEHVWTFKNAYEPRVPGEKWAPIKVTKTVSGEGASANEEFEFEITYTPYRADKPVTETFKLKANESKGFVAAAGTNYTVVEKLTDEQKKAGWAAKKTELTGKTSEDGSEVEVEAENTFTKPTTPDNPNNPDKPDNPDSPNSPNSPSSPNTPGGGTATTTQGGPKTTTTVAGKGLTQTGDTTLLFAAAVTAVAALGLGGVAFIRRRQAD